MKAILGIGTNIGERENNITLAVESLSRLPLTSVENVSAMYETKPWGYAEQNNFVNVCVMLETNLSPNALLGACLGIESAMGRLRPFKNSPRIIDIDVLLYEDIRMNTDELKIPHPFIKERSFVLVPMHDIIYNNKFFSYDISDAYEKCDKSEIIKKI